MTKAHNTDPARLDDSFLDVSSGIPTELNLQQIS